MKQRLQRTAICLDDHLISNFGQGRNGVWDPNCLCKHTTFKCMDSTYYFGRVHADVISALMTVLYFLDVNENTLTTHAPYPLMEDLGMTVWHRL